MSRRQQPIVAPKPNHPERWLTIRVYGNILYTTGAWGNNNMQLTNANPLKEAHIDSWMKDCAEHGVTAVLWQANCGGTLTHTSPVFPLSGPPLPPHNDAWLPVWNFLGDQIRAFNTLTVGIAAAHKYGLRFAYSLCLWDFVDSPFEDSIFHPNLWMLSREGEPFFGVPCYAEPKTQELMLKYIRDVLDREIDDLAITFFTHAQGQGTDRPNHYGFNQSLTEAYKKKHNIDPRQGSFDASNLASITGDAYTGFLRLLHKETSQRGQRLIACTTPDGKWGWGGSGGQQLWDYYNDSQSTPTIPPNCSIELQWQQWVQEKIVDGLLVSVSPENSIVQCQEMRNATNIPILLWRKVNPAVTSDQFSLFEDEAISVGEKKVDGYVVHAMFVWMKNASQFGDYPPKLWHLIRYATGENPTHTED